MNEIVSVIIPTYNRSNVIERAIRSVLNQSYNKLEVIVVDDCSTDDTAIVVNRINDSRVKFYKMDKNCGPAAARNQGVKISCGEYIAFQDSDDVWMPQKLEKQLKVLCGDVYSDFVFCSYRINGTGEIIPSERDFITNDFFNNELEYLLKGNFIGTPTMLMTRRLFDRVGGFNKSLRTLEDWEFVLRVADNTKISFVEDYLVEVYRSNDGVNNIVGESRAFFEARVIARYWEKCKDKSVFVKLFSQLYDDLIDMSEESRRSVFLVLNETLTNLDGIKLVVDVKRFYEKQLFDNDNLREFQIKSIREEQAEECSKINEGYEKYIKEIVEDLERQRKETEEGYEKYIREIVADQEKQRKETEEGYEKYIREIVADQEKQRKETEEGYEKYINEIVQDKDRLRKETEEGYEQYIKEIVLNKEREKKELVDSLAFQVSKKEYISEMLNKLLMASLKKDDSIENQLYGRRIVVYGMGILGKALCNFLENSNIAVEFVVDCDKNEYKNYKFANIEDILNEDFLVIITSYDPSREIRNRYCESMNCFIYFDEMI